MYHFKKTNQLVIAQRKVLIRQIGYGINKGWKAQSNNSGSGVSLVNSYNKNNEKLVYIIYDDFLFNI